MENWIKSGKIVGTVGLRGEVKVQSWSDSPDFLAGFKRIFIDGQEYSITGSRISRSAVILKLQGIDTVDQAMGMHGKIICIARADVELPKGTFFIRDLIGMTVHDLRLDRDIGELYNVLNLPAGDVYVIHDGNNEYMIPVNANFIKSVNIETRIITVNTIKGMTGDE